MSFLRARSAGIEQAESDRLANLEERCTALEAQRLSVDQRIDALEQFFRPTQEQQRQRERDGEPDEIDIGTQLAVVLRFGEKLKGLEARISARLEDQLQAELQAHEAELSSLNSRFLAEMDNLRATTTAQNAVTTANLRLRIEELEKTLAAFKDSCRHEPVAPATKLEADGQDTKARWAPWTQKMGAMQGALDALEAKDLPASPLKEVLDQQASFLASHEAEIKKLKEALSYDAASKRNRTHQSQLLQGEDQDERRRNGELQVFEDRAEWLVRDALAWKAALPKGQAMDSPPFNIDAPGIGTLQGLVLRFYPSGGRSAFAEDTCSLHLVHPFDMAWSKYELYIGGCVKGPFDPIYGGSDDFCSFSGSLEEDETGEARVLVGVKFLPAGNGVTQGEQACER
eukprot:TRINITY_DN18427_c0_g1_i2.p1 TRINITY_DN18427_c0_g1~~TRINITY_DN18427_c0_g1_i2.p1  ORF type:complete len:400 (+),score=90.30 TRINITY_DN18427_c0_g1_i2:74-1273(+)